MKRKKLSLHVNRRIAADASKEFLSERPPIVEVNDSPQGLIELKVRDSQGHRIGFFQIASEDLDDDFVEYLKAWQARHAHELSHPELVLKS